MASKSNNTDITIAIHCIIYWKHIIYESRKKCLLHFYRIQFSFTWVHFYTLKYSIQFNNNIKNIGLVCFEVQAHSSRPRKFRLRHCGPNPRFSGSSSRTSGGLSSPSVHSMFNWHLARVGSLFSTDWTMGLNVGSGGSPLFGPTVHRSSAVHSQQSLAALLSRITMDCDSKLPPWIAILNCEVQCISQNQILGLNSEVQGSLPPVHARFSTLKFTNFKPNSPIKMASHCDEKIQSPTEVWRRTNCLVTPHKSTNEKRRYTHSWASWWDTGIGDISLAYSVCNLYVSLHKATCIKYNKIHTIIYILNIHVHIPDVKIQSHSVPLWVWSTACFKFLEPSITACFSWSTEPAPAHCTKNIDIHSSFLWPLGMAISTTRTTKNPMRAVVQRFSQLLLICSAVCIHSFVLPRQSTHNRTNSLRTADRRHSEHCNDSCVSALSESSSRMVWFQCCMPRLVRTDLNWYSGHWQVCDWLRNSHNLSRCSWPGWTSEWWLPLLVFWPPSCGISCHHCRSCCIFCCCKPHCALLSMMSRLLIDEISADEYNRHFH